MLPQEVLGRSVTVQREPLAGEGDYILIYRYADCANRWGDLSAGALRLMWYFLLVEWRKDGMIIFDKAGTVEAMNCSAHTIYRWMRELKEKKFLDRIRGGYLVDRRLAEIITREDLKKRSA